MQTLLKWIGGGWAGIGIFCIVIDLVVTAPAAVTEREREALAVAMIVHILVFVFPGLILYGAGEAGAARRQGQ